jgi:hypothetical protein
MNWYDYTFAMALTGCIYALILSFNSYDWALCRVLQRQDRADFKCRPQKVWYGWRVKELDWDWDWN